MSLAPLRTALIATAAGAAIASCAGHRARHEDTFVAARSLGESTASPGSNPDRPVARSLDTQELSAPLSVPPTSETAPPPQAPIAQPPSPRPAPAPVTPPPPPPPPEGGSPGAFAPPPPPPPP